MTHPGRDVDEPRPQEERLSTAAVYAVPVALAVAAMLPSLLGGFVLDDNVAIVGSRCVTGPFDLSLIWERNFWCQPPREATIATWRPWPVVIWWAFWRLGGGSPLPFHGLNVVLHGLCALMVVRLGLATIPRRPRRGALTAGLLFAAMPIHADAVASLVGVAELWSLLLGMAALELTLRLPFRKHRGVGLVAIVATLALALASKESSLAFVVLAALCVVIGPFDAEARRKAALVVPLAAALGLSYLVVRASVVGTLTGTYTTVVENALVQHPWIVRLPMALELLGRYARLAAVGYPLSADYSTDAIPITVWGPGVVLGGLLLAGLVWLAWVKRRDPAVRLFVLWFLGSFLFISNVVALLPVLFAERMFYGPSAALCLLVGWLAAGRLGRVRKAVAALAVATLCGWAVLGGLHAWAWRSEESISAVTAERSAGSARAHVWRARTLGRSRGDPAQMERHARRAIEILPQWGQPYAFLGAALATQGRPREAVVEFDRGFTRSPFDGEVADLFIQFLLHYGHEREARDVFLRHVRSRGGRPDPSVTVPPGIEAVAPLAGDGPETQS